MFRDIGCDYCFWTIHFRFVVNSPFRVVYRVVFQEPPELPKCKVKGPSNLNKHRQQQGLPLSLISNILKLELISRNEPLTQILFVSSRTVGRSAPGFQFRLHVTCPPSHAFREIIKIKKKMEHKLEKYKMSYSKYSNWPSCDSSDWMTRYWGEIATCLVQLILFQGRTILGCWRSKPGGTPGTCSTIARASEAPTTPVALLPSTGLRVLHLLSFSMIVTAGNPEQRLTK